MADQPAPTSDGTQTGGTPPEQPRPAQGSLPLPNGDAAPKGDDAAALRAQLEAARAEAERGRAAQAELARLQAERDAAEQERLAKQGEWQQLAEQRAKETAELQKRILSERVRATAISEGLIDESLVDMIPTDDSFLVNGKPDQNKIAQAVASFKAAKAHFFKSSSGAGTGAGSAPPPAETPGQRFDFRTLQLDSKGGKSAVTVAKGQLDAMFERAKRELHR